MVIRGLVDELYEYNNLGVLKNYVGSFSSDVEDNIDKARKKVDLVFASNFDRRKVNPLVYVKLWRQACLPLLLFGAELWTLTPTLLGSLSKLTRRPRGGGQQANFYSEGLKAK